MDINNFTFSWVTPLYIVTGVLLYNPYLIICLLSTLYHHQIKQI